MEKLLDVIVIKSGCCLKNCTRVDNILALPSIVNLSNAPVLCAHCMYLVIRLNLHPPLLRLYSADGESREALSQLLCRRSTS